MHRLEYTGYASVFVAVAAAFSVYLIPSPIDPKPYRYVFNNNIPLFLFFVFNNNIPLFLFVSKVYIASVFY